MRGDQIIATQLLMAQGVNALAEMVSGSTGYYLKPTLMADLPDPPFGPTETPGPHAAGPMACISDSTVNTMGATVVGGGSHTVLAWFNGTYWTVIGI